MTADGRRSVNPLLGRVPRSVVGASVRAEISIGRVHEQCISTEADVNEATESPRLGERTGPVRADTG